MTRFVQFTAGCYLSALCLPCVSAEDVFPTGEARDPADAYVFSQIDQDGDGYASQAEIDRTTWEEVKVAFDRLDTDRDGFLSKTEYDRFFTR